MRYCARIAIVLSLALLAVGALPAEAAIILYNQDFENPSGFVNDGGDININRTVNQLYGNQPVGFSFAQANTVETLLITGAAAFGTGYSDPQGIGGNYAVSMLSGFGVQNDLLAMSFNVQGENFLNIRLNISSIDLDRFGGPFNPASGSVSAFDVLLYDNPTGAVNLMGNGTLLDSTRIIGLPANARNEFNWTQHLFGLDASAATNGNVTVVFDLVADAAYARYGAFDNFRIAASDIEGDVGDPPPPTPPPTTVPEPSSLWLLALALSGLAAFRSRK